MVVGVLELELLLHGPQNLKEKRAIIRKLLARLRNRFPVSAAETGQHDSWQRSRLGLAIVGVDAGDIERLFERIEDEISSSGLAELGPRSAELLHY